MTYSLTAKQSACLKYITERIEADGVAPSFQEIVEHLGLASKSGVHRLVTALVERGHLVRIKNRARSLALPTEKKGGDITMALLEMDLAVTAAISGATSRIEALHFIRGKISAVRGAA